MRFKHKDVEVRISQRTLWVDMQAYPLAQITRVRPLELIYKRGRLAGRYAWKMLATIVLGVIGMLGMVGMRLLGLIGHTALLSVSEALVTVTVIMLAAHTVRLAYDLARRWHVLSVATSGSPHAAVISTNQDTIHNLAHRVVEAIDNPSMEFAQHVDHVEIVYGDKYGGDRVGGDKIFSGWS